MDHGFWKQDVFRLVIAGCLVFAVLTVVAMFFYPGGTFTDPDARGYSFFENFFSELGMLRTHAGEPKAVSLVLFVLSMFLVGVGMALFFLAFPRLFRRTPAGRALGTLGSILGVLSAFCFWGVAAFPVDVNLPAHTQSVIWAFRLFPAAVLCYAVVLFSERGLSSGHAWALVAFLVFLVSYLVLLEVGPGIGSYAGMVIQAAGQKVVVYASIFSLILQSWGAVRHV